MRRCFGWLGLMALFLAMLPAFAADDDADTKTKPDAPDKKQADKLIKSGKSFVGKLVKVDGAKHVLTVEVTYKAAKQDPQVAQNLARLQLRMVEAQRNRNAIERARQLSQIQIDIDKNTRNLYKDTSQKIDLDAPDEMKVRTMVLPVELDDKGKPRKLTEKEKRDLKGPDPNLPGYLGDFDSLKPDQTVNVYPAKQPPKSKDKDSDSNDSSRPRVAMIVILAETQK
jgi:hypothetical protein